MSDVDEGGGEGVVHFRAVALNAESALVLEERSRFTLIEGAWCYVDGACVTTELTPGRNKPCVCGSGKTFKRCCKGRVTPVSS